MIERVGGSIFTAGFVDAVIRGNATGDLAGPPLNFNRVRPFEHGKINVAWLQLALKILLGFGFGNHKAVRRIRPLDLDRHAVDTLAVGVFYFDKDVMLTAIFARG